MKQLEPDCEVAFVGTSRGLEQRLIPEAGYRLHLVNMVPFSGKNRVTLPLALVRATMQSRALLRKRRTSVAVGMGGYAGVPLVIAARMRKTPSLIHESGAIPGKANLVASRFTGNVALAFESSLKFFANARVVGMPLRSEIAGFNRAALRESARASFGLAPDQLMVLVVGGSQGAASLNEAAIALAQRWEKRSDIAIIIKTGTASFDAVNGAVSGSKVARAVAFLDRMDLAYAAADLAICRAGASTVAELTVVGLPAIVVPYPHATKDHQAVNAQALVEVGGAVMVRDHDATEANLGPLIEGLVEDRGRLQVMQEGLAKVSRPNAAHDLARWVLALAR